MKVTNNLDLTGLQILNMRLQVLAAAPTPKGEGHTYYDSVAKAAFTWDGTAWVPADARKAVNIPLSALATDPLARANHTGTQTANTISNLKTTVVAYRLDEFAAPTAAVSLNGQRLTNVATPTTGTDGVNRDYVDNAVQQAAAGIDSKPSVRAATTANLTLSALQTIDGVSLASGDRVLVKNQTTATQNGVYVAASGAWARAADADQNGEMTPGSTWFVEEGTTNGKTTWRIENTGAIALGSTAITINQLTASASYAAGNGLTLTGNTFAVKPSTGITVTAAGVAVDTTVVARKYSQIIGDGTTTTFVITHNLNTSDVIVQVISQNGLDYVLADIGTNSVNAVNVVFAEPPSTNAYRVVVVG